MRRKKTSKTQRKRLRKNNQVSGQIKVEESRIKTKARGDVTADQINQKGKPKRKINQSDGDPTNRKYWIIQFGQGRI